MDNWRDSGWSVGCRRETLELEVVVSQIRETASGCYRLPQTAALELSAVCSVAGRPPVPMMFMIWLLS